MSDIQNLSASLVARGANPKALGRELGKRLGKSEKTGRKLLNNPDLLTIGDIRALRLKDEEILAIVRKENIK